MRALLVLATVAVGLAAAPAASAWTVTMTAQPTFKRTHHWAIEKSVSQPTLTLAPGQTADVTYSVTVKSTGLTDSDWAVEGTVDMTTGGFETVVVNDVVVFVEPPDGFLATTTCSPSPFPVLLAPGLHCDYSTALPDASPRTAQMRANATVNGVDGQRAVNTPFDFTNATITEVDECVTVTDTMAGSLGTVCAGDAPKTFTYTKTIGGFGQCGPHSVPNTASFLTGDTGASGSASANVDVTVPCGEACTRTIGYWKTHAGFGPQADVVTPLLPITLGTAGGAKSLNVTTAAFAVQLLSMEGSNGVKAASNGINKLYAQLLGAKLNGANGASTADVAATIAAADAYLATHDSLSWKSLSKSEQQTVLDWMTALDNYNNGLVGPRHCD